MKKYFLIVTILLVNVCGAMAQQEKGSMAVGVNLAYGSEISNLGFGAKFQYGLTEAIRLEPSANYFLGDAKWLDASLNVHYLFNVAESVNVYPLAGITYASVKGYENGSLNTDNFDENGDWTPSESSRSGKFGFNVGVGAEYALNDIWSINAEAKYQIINNFNQIVVGAGLTYRF